ncbi:Desiccation-related protein PCC13-62 [Linum grandiflorum]
MLKTMGSSIFFFFFIIMLLLPLSHSYGNYGIPPGGISSFDVDLIEFPLNLEYLEAEFFMYGALGHGLDVFAPNLSAGGPPSIGGCKAHLDPVTQNIIEQFAWQEVGHLRAIKSKVKGFPRPELDISAASFAKVINSAFGKPLSSPFDPYANSINYLIASYIIPYVGLTGYVGANSKLQASASRKLVAGLLAVEAGQDAVIRGMLYERASKKVEPYNITVAEFTNKISEVRNKLGKEGVRDEGLLVPKYFGAEMKVRGNVLAGDELSLGYGRSAEQILRIVYGGAGNESSPGGFFPKGASGRIATSYLSSSPDSDLVFD